MFQYTFGLIKSLEQNDKLFLDIHSYDKSVSFSKRKYELNVFGIVPLGIDIKKVPRWTRPTSYELYYLFQILVKKLIHHIPWVYFCERWSWYEGKIDLADTDKIVRGTYIEGFFQSDRYFKTYEDIVKNNFRFTKLLNDYTIQFMKDNFDDNRINIFVHVRRWDYIKDPIASRLHWLCDIDYYHRAISHIKDEIGDNYKFLIFSDDIERCKENFVWEEYVFVEDNKWQDSWQDMYLMSKCDHGIIANSSFSRRWAYLIESANKIVIAPKQRNKFTTSNNICPEEWIRI